jgi:microcin C transport system substrate-binding protein
MLERPMHRPRVRRFATRVQSALAVAAIAGLGTTLAGATPDVASRPAHGLAMHGDLKYPPDFQHLSYVNPDAPKGGSLRLGASGTFDSFNPYILKGTGAAGLGGGLGSSLVYESLLEDTHDEPFSTYGRLAETVETPPDRSFVRFVLREAARWHDGKPVTADDVVFSFETLMAKGSPIYGVYYAGVDRVEKSGERTVTFFFKPGENRELPLILGQLPVLPKHYWKDRDFQATTLEPPLGSGPYRIAKFEAGRYVEYERVPTYWGRDLPLLRGRNNFDTMRYDYYRDELVEREAFKGGQLDFRPETNSKDWATAYEIPEVAQGWIVKRMVPHTQPAGMQGYVYNLRRPIFADPRVRQALASAFDFEWSNRTLFYGQYVRTRSYYENSELASRGLPSAEERAVLEPLRDQLPPEVFTTEYMPPTTEGTRTFRDNLRRAVELLASAGYEVKRGVMTHKETGAKLSFEIILAQVGFERITLPFVSNLKRIGVDATVRTLDSAQFEERMKVFNYDMTVLSFRQSRSTGNEQRDMFGSEAADREGSRNYAGIENTAIDALIETLIASPDRATLVARTRALDRVLQWGHYVIPHWHINADRVVYWNKFRSPEYPGEDGVLVDTWWVDPELNAKLRAYRNQG